MSKGRPGEVGGKHRFQTVPVCGLPVAVLDYRQAVRQIMDWAAHGDRAYAVEAANTHVAALTRSDPEFEAAMKRFDLVCPDGMPLVWAANLSLPPGARMDDRVYGPNLMLRAIEASSGEPSIRHFFLGGEQRTLDRLGERFAADCPESVVAGSYSPPFGTWPDDEFERICGKISECGANVIWVGLGCPKQELWIAQNKDKLPPGVYLGVGAAFAFHAGEVRQAPYWLQRFGLEWAFRLLQEPRRLWGRYSKYNTIFVREFLRDHVAAEEAPPAMPPNQRVAATLKQGFPARCSVLGVGIHAMDLPTATHLVMEGAGKPGFTGYVTVTGVHGVMESQRDDELRRIHNRSYLTTPDGMPMVWITRWRGFDGVDRVYGPDLLMEVVRSSAGTGQSHYFWGGDEGVADDLARRLQGFFPGTEVAGAITPPFGSIGEAEEEELATALQNAKPGFLWVGLSTPKQERFMHGFLQRHPDLVKDWPHGLVLLGVGAAFDFHSGRLEQAPIWMQRRGLEWFFRLCMEPRRLWRRYSINNSSFIFAIIPQLIGLREYPLEK
ncbi:MAG: WecB/TagA/CpsF family glycosyltransferase [Akkermansiaceae bacterium]|nr:WecB/TagA/CpsF family glycosyltransferase [Akkermansiaceae bacterium]NNM31133.1 WecB/TagA/CpsF family glycosyltransferase [Akkermansiaceae bacterium]